MSNVACQIGARSQIIHYTLSIIHYLFSFDTAKVRKISEICKFFTTFFHAFLQLFSASFQQLSSPLSRPSSGRRYVLRNKMSRLLAEDVTSSGRGRYVFRQATICANVQSANTLSRARKRRLEYSIYYNYLYINILHIILLLYYNHFPFFIFRKTFALCTFAQFSAKFCGCLKNNVYLCARNMKYPKYQELTMQKG